MKFVKMLQKVNESVKSCVQANGQLGDDFESFKGVKQGEPLSPL